MVDALIVLRNPQLSATFRKFLLHAGITYSEAKSKNKALELLKTREYKVIFAIHSQLDGIDFAQEIKQRQIRSLIVIGLDLDASRKTKQELFDLGVEWIVHMPVDFSELLRTLQKAISKYDAIHEGIQITSVYLRPYQPKVLIVDDNPHITSTLSDLLRRINVEIRCASNALQALDIAMTEGFDVLLSDVMMPGMDGFTLISKLRRAYPSSLLVIISALDDRASMMQGFECGADIFIGKPFDYMELLFLIQHFTDSNRWRIYESLSLVAKSSDLALLVCSVESITGSDLPFPYSNLCRNQAIPLSLIQGNDYFSVLSIENIDETIAGVVESFYEQPAIKQREDVILTFGFVCGPFQSVVELIEAAARDHLERRKSQGLLLRSEPAILQIHQERVRLLQRLALSRAHLAQLESFEQKKDLVIRDQVSKLTRRFRHDLVGNLLRIDSMATLSSQDSSQTYRVRLAVKDCLETLEIIKHTTEADIELADSYDQIRSFAELQVTVTTIDNAVAAAEQRLLQHPTSSGNEDILLSARDLLLPYLLKLEHQIDNLVLLISTIKSTHEPLRLMADRIQRTARFSALLIQNLLLAIQGKMLPIEHIDIQAAITEVLDVLEPLFSEISITTNFAAEQVIATISAVELRQVLTNIIVNAAEATEKGGSIHIRTRRSVDSVVVEIQDNGFGIPSEHRDKIFQLNFSTKGRGTDAGVGLYIVYTIVSQAGGRIGLASATHDAKGNLVAWARGMAEASIPSWDQSGTLFQIMLPLATQ